MRKSYIDNIRWLAVLMLFPYHIIMIYNSFGEGFYIKGEDIQSITTFVFASWPWFMPLLFVVAGISTAYALQKRGVGEYVKERITKLFIPLLAGILLVIPSQTYYAERFHNGYTGSYFAQYILFFTKETDLTGNTGGFTPAQLWFILYLFVISLAAIPLILLGKKSKFPFGKVSMSVIPFLFILPLLGSLLLNIAGKSLGEYFVYFMLGYFLLSHEEIQKKLERRKYIFLGAAFAAMIALILWWYNILPLHQLFYDIGSRLYAWLMILAVLGLGRKHLNASNKFTAYMSHSSFCVYIFHQSWIILTAYYAFQLTDKAFLQMALILPVSVILTFASYELCKRISVTRFLFAIKKQNANRMLKHIKPNATTIG